MQQQVFLIEFGTSPWDGSARAVASILQLVVFIPLAVALHFQTRALVQKRVALAELPGGIHLGGEAKP